MTRSLGFAAALIAGLQTLFGAVMSLTAGFGVVAGVGFSYAMCTDGHGCESPTTLLAKGALLVTVVVLLLAVAPGVVAIGLVKNRRWAPLAGTVVELALAAGIGLWLVLQKPPLPDYYVVGIPAVALVAAVLMGGLVVTRSRTDRTGTRAA